MFNFNLAMLRLRKGVPLTDTELYRLNEDLSEILKVLSGKGDLFAASKDLASNELQRVKGYLFARGLETY